MALSCNGGTQGPAHYVSNEAENTKAKNVLPEVWTLPVVFVRYFFVRSFHFCSSWPSVGISQEPVRLIPVVCPVYLIEDTSVDINPIRGQHDDTAWVCESGSMNKPCSKVVSLGCCVGMSAPLRKNMAVSGALSVIQHVRAARWLLYVSSPRVSDIIWYSHSGEINTFSSSTFCFKMIMNSVRTG